MSKTGKEFLILQLNQETEEPLGNNIYDDMDHYYYTEDHMYQYEQECCFPRGSVIIDE